MLGLGSYAPENRLTNLELSKKVDTSDDWIFSRTGISERRIASDEESTSDLAMRAAQNALKDADVLPEEIDLVVVATITPDMAFPSTACLLQHKLGLRNVCCFDLEAACSGFVYALDLTGEDRRKNYRVLSIGKIVPPACFLAMAPVPPYWGSMATDLDSKVFYVERMEPIRLYFVNLLAVPPSRPRWKVSKAGNIFLR